MKPLCAFCSILSNGCHRNSDFYKKIVFWMSGICFQVTGLCKMSSPSNHREEKTAANLNSQMFSV